MPERTGRWGALLQGSRGMAVVLERSELFGKDLLSAVECTQNVGVVFLLERRGRFCRGGSL